MLTKQKFYNLLIPKLIETEVFGDIFRNFTPYTDFANSFFGHYLQYYGNTVLVSSDEMLT